MSFSERRLTGNDLDTCAWQLTFEPNDPHVRFGLGYPYLEKLQEAQRSGDEFQHIFRLLSAITGLSFGEEGTEPLVPPALLNEIHADDLRVLASRVNDVQDLELRARIRDLSWVVNRDHQAGVLAVGDYLEAADQVMARGSWIGYCVLTKRALRLAKSLRNDGAIALAVDHMTTFLREYQITHEVRFLARDFIRALLEARAGDANDLAGHAHRIASDAEGAEEWDRAQAHWEVEAKCYDRLRDAEAARQARIRAAESRVHEARDEAAKGPPFTGAAASKLLEAVKLFQVQGERTRADAIYREALELQQIARGETGTILMDVDLTRSTGSARAAVRGKELIPALASLANLFQPLNVAWLRAQTEEEITQYPIQHLIQKTLRDERGGVVARRESRGDGNEDADERALQADMWENAKFYRGGYVAMAIDPARTLILSEHQPTIQDFLDIAAAAPFVPSGREMVFAKGLLAGMQGDFLQGLHLLVPQLEYAIRRIFEQDGVLTTTLDQDDVQEDRTLGLLLQDARFQKAATAIFGKDLLFDLRGLLVEKWGGNLRNRVSHGLMRDDDFNDPQCQYLWWLTLRFVMWPYVLAMAQVDSAQASDDQQSAESVHADEEGTGTAASDL